MRRRCSGCCAAVRWKARTGTPSPTWRRPGRHRPCLPWRCRCTRAAGRRRSTAAWAWRACAWPRSAGTWCSNRCAGRPATTATVSTRRSWKCAIAARTACWPCVRAGTCASAAMPSKPRWTRRWTRPTCLRGHRSWTGWRRGCAGARPGGWRWPCRGRPSATASVPCACSRTWSAPSWTCRRRWPNRPTRPCRPRWSWPCPWAVAPSTWPSASAWPCVRSAGTDRPGSGSSSAPLRWMRRRRHRDWW